MKRSLKKYAICLSLILIMGTGIVVGIGMLKQNKIVQPQGEYMSFEEAMFLMGELSMNGENSEGKEQSEIGQNNASKDVTYQAYVEKLHRLAGQNLLTDEQMESLKASFENKYLPEHYMLKEDFLDGYLELAGIVTDEITRGEVFLLTGADNVWKLENREYLGENEILSSKEEVYVAGMLREGDRRALTDGYFNQVEAILKGNTILYVIRKEESEAVLQSCFVAEHKMNGLLQEDNDSTDAKEKLPVLTVYWNTYALQIPNPTEYERMEDVVDLTFKNSTLEKVEIYQDKVNGKLLSVDEAYVELQHDDEEIKRYELSEQVKAYQLFGEKDETNPYTMEDLKIGYNFSDFVLNKEGKVVAALSTREETMENIRVLLKTSDFAGYYHETVDFSCDTDFDVIVAGEATHYGKGESVCFDQGSDVSVGQRILVKPNALTARTKFSSILRNKGAADYRGTFEIERTEEGYVVINELLLEEYLYSVVPSEMPATYPLEALKAQAVCARTYAYKHIVKSSLKKYGAHVDDSTAFQVYNNIAESQSATQAVRETSGMIAKKDDRIVEAYFYSTSSGFGADLSVWHSNSGNTSYLVSKSISDNTERNASDMKNEEVFLNHIQSICENDYEKEESWYRWKYTTRLDEQLLVEKLRGRYEAKPDMVLTRKGAEFVSAEIGDIGSIKNISVLKRLEGGVMDELLITAENAEIKVIGENTIRTVLANDSKVVALQNGKEAAVSSLIPSAFAAIEVSQDANGFVTEYIVTGGGYGHGIGMSQNGAKNMAERGYHFEEILNFFYEGATVEK